MVLLQKLVPSQKIDAELVVRNSCGELGEMSMSNQAVRKSGAAVPKWAMPAMPKKTMSLDASRRIIFYFSVLLSLNNLVHFNPLASGGNRSWLWQCSRLPKEPRCSSCGPCCLVLEVEDGMMIHIGNTLSFFMGCTGLETSTSEQHTAYTTALFTPCPVALINSLARIDFMNQCTGERKIHFRVHSLITVWKDDRRDAVFRAKAASSRVLQHSVDGLAGLTSTRPIWKDKPKGCSWCAENVQQMLDDFKSLKAAYPQEPSNFFLVHLLFSICWEWQSQRIFTFLRGVGEPPTRYCPTSPRKKAQIHHDPSILRQDEFDNFSEKMTSTQHGSQDGHERDGSQWQSPWTKATPRFSKDYIWSSYSWPMGKSVIYSNIADHYWSFIYIYIHIYINIYIHIYTYIYSHHWWFIEKTIFWPTFGQNMAEPKVRSWHDLAQGWVRGVRGDVHCGYPWMKVTKVGKTRQNMPEICQMSEQTKQE